MISLQTKVTGRYMAKQDVFSTSEYENIEKNPNKTFNVGLCQQQSKTVEAYVAMESIKIGGSGIHADDERPSSLADVHLWSFCMLF